MKIFDAPARNVGRLVVEKEGYKISYTILHSTHLQYATSVCVTYNVESISVYNIR